MHKVLVMDDEVEVLETICCLIDDKLPCEIVKCSNGLDGFLETQKSQFDLIITDHKMPFMTGAAFIIACRSKETKNQKTPIIMLSGFIDPDLKKTLGIQNVTMVEKPFTPDDLIDVIRTYLI